MDDARAFAKVVVEEESSSSSSSSISSNKRISYYERQCPSAIRTNLVFHEPSLYHGGKPSIYLLAMNDELVRKAGDFYKPSVPVRCRSDCDIWNFVSCTNKARK